MSTIMPPPSDRPRTSNRKLDEDAGPQKINRQLRDMFREAFDNLGGATWLVEFATANDQNARVFVQAISKLLPPSASPPDKQPVIIDIPWLTRDRLEYKRIDDAVILQVQNGRDQSESA